MIDDDDADDNNIIIIVIIMLMMMMILDDDELGVSIPRPPIIPPSQKATALATRRRLALDTRRLAAAFALTWPTWRRKVLCSHICIPWQKTWKQIWPIHRYGYEIYEYGYKKGNKYGYKN